MSKVSGLYLELMKTFNLNPCMTVFLLYKYAPALLCTGFNKSETVFESIMFEDLKKRYKCIKPHMTEEGLNALCISDANLKNAEKWLINRLHQSKQITLYNKLYEQGVAGDVRSISEFARFSKSFINDDSEEDEEALFFKSIMFSDDSNDYGESRKSNQTDKEDIF
ncbi:MAG: hypothetical protein FWG70_03965 [Oscillospiraceae bacterium]|nr:hypothetical protein [Oscillospiraceae bacterium]